MKKISKLLAVTLMSFAMIGSSGCTIDKKLTDEGAIGGGTAVASLSDEKLNEEEIRALKEGTNFPDSFLGDAIIYDQQKMLFTYQGSSGCPEHPESVNVEQSTLKIKFSENNKENICTAVITGPFHQVINLPVNFTRKDAIKVIAVMGSREIEIPVTVN